MFFTYKYLMFDFGKSWASNSPFLACTVGMHQQANPVRREVRQGVCNVGDHKPFVSGAHNASRWT